FTPLYVRNASMIEKNLNIISFNIPYPPDYGGVIDVFYKLKALAENNIKIILHTFEYGRKKSSELEKYCDKVYYYTRKTGFRSQLSFIPYIVYSRRNEELLHNLQSNNFPILFEGLHTCYYLNHSSLKERLKIVRAHNIEHQYYKGLAANTHNITDKIYFKLETSRLQSFESKLKYADHILALSSTEYAYFSEKYGKDKTQYIPLFFQSENKISLSPVIKPYIIYHGDLSTPENISAAKFLINNIAAKTPEFQWIFTGRNPHQTLISLINNYKNIQLIPNPEEDELKHLIREAAINILYTNQVSGVKLKLLNTLYHGHTCLANKKMVAGSGLEELCTLISDDPERIIQDIRKYMHEPFHTDELQKREVLFKSLYNNKKNALAIKALL
ncbi:MAG: glycosyltransferase family 1 protein, partial [Bacteroidales bacterium]|nr:glycosyltransferase family 1 protein [Bacteroidales bacterium]